MNSEEANLTISESKEESLLKALELLGQSQQELPPISRPNINTKKVVFCFLIWLSFCVGANFGIVYLCGFLKIPDLITWAYACFR